MALTALQARNSIAVVEDIANDRKKQRRKLKNFKSKSEASETEELLDKDNGAPANQKIVRTQSVRMEPRQTQYQKNALLQERNASGMSDLDMLYSQKLGNVLAAVIKQTANFVEVVQIEKKPTVHS